MAALRDPNVRWLQQSYRFGAVARPLGVSADGQLHQCRQLGSFAIMHLPSWLLRRL